MGKNLTEKKFLSKRFVHIFQLKDKIEAKQQRKQQLQCQRERERGGGQWAVYYTSS